jgi:hypothetical protein
MATEENNYAGEAGVECLEPSCAAAEPAAQEASSGDVQAATAHAASDIYSKVSFGRAAFVGATSELRGNATAEEAQSSSDQTLSSLSAMTDNICTIEKYC